MLYVDSSALLRRYVEEPDSAVGERHLLADPAWLTARHTYVEVRRNLGRLVPRGRLSEALEAFSGDWDRFFVVELDKVTCERAAEIAAASGARSLDALHLAAAQRVGGSDLRLLTFDVRQAQAARALGLTVVGV